MDTPRRTRTYRSHHLDSERWDHVTLRPGDVVISTSIRWYLRFNLSYRDVEELLVERGVDPSASSDNCREEP
jgi:hypothetical protein